MLIRPNHATLEGEVLGVARHADGFGADVRLKVLANVSADRERDFTGAVSGQVLTLFAAVPEALRRGKRYRIDAIVRGGPLGERVVIEHAAELGV